MDQIHLDAFVRAVFSATFLIASADGDVSVREIQTFVDELDRRFDLQMDTGDVEEAFRDAVALEIEEHLERIAEASHLPEALRKEVLSLALLVVASDGEVVFSEVESLPSIAEALGVALLELELESIGAGIGHFDDDADGFADLTGEKFGSGHVPVATDSLAIADEESGDPEYSSPTPIECGLRNPEIFEVIGELQHRIAGCLAVGFVRSGSEIVALGRDDELLFMDARSGRLLAERDTNCDWRKLETSSDGLLLAMFGGYSRSVGIWSVSERRLIAKIPGEAVSAVFDSSGTALYIGTEDGVVSKWSTENYSRIYSVQGFLEGVGSLALSSDGTSLAAADKWRNSVVLLNAVDGSRKLELALPAPAQDMLFHPAAEILITSATDGKSKPFQAWNVSNGKIEASFGRSPGTAGSSARISLSKDGTKLVTTHGSSLRFWNAETFDCLCEPASEGLMFDTASFTDNGREVFGFCRGDWLEEQSGGRCFLWDATTGSVVAVAEVFPSGDYFPSLAILNDIGDRAVLAAKMDASATAFTLKLLRLNFSNIHVNASAADLEPLKVTQQARAEAFRKTLSEMNSAIGDLNRLAADLQQTDAASQQTGNRSDPTASKGKDFASMSRDKMTRKRSFWSRLFGL